MANVISPQGWLEVTLADIADWGSGGTPSRKMAHYFCGQIPWIKTGELGDKFVLSSEEKITEEAILSSSAKIFPRGSVGIAMYGATIGKTSIFGVDASTNQACAVAIPSQAINNEFLYYFLLSEKYGFIKAGTGGAQPNISQGVIKNWPIKLPPLAEQLRIVAKIEELFSELDKGVENLRTAQQQLKVYRQALLKHAFEGKLTADWRAQNPDKLESADALLARIQQKREARYQQQWQSWKAAHQAWETNGKTGNKTIKPKAPKALPPLTNEELKELPELPPGWVWVKVSDLATKITDGEHFKPDTQESGIYFLSAKDVQSSGVIFDNPLFISVETAAKARLRCDPERNDILIVSRGATVGRMCIVDTDKVFCLLGSVILIKPLHAVCSSYLLFSLKSPLINKKIVSISGSTAQQAIYLRDIQHVAVPYCSLDEQQEVSKLLDEKLSIIDALEASLDSELTRAEALRQSILKKAFSGQLVPQDPNDEPASVLLERIRAERAAQPKARGRERKAKAPV